MVGISLFWTLLGHHRMSWLKLEVSLFQRSFEEKLHSLVISELIKYHVKIIDDMCECKVMNP